MLSTWLTERFGVAVPVVSAPMGGMADGRFAAAVSAAGGLGMVGVDAQSADTLREEITRAASAGPAYGVGMLAWLLPELPAQLEVVRETKPPLVSLSFGRYEPYVAPLRDAGIVVATQVCTLDDARRAVDAGIDVLVARGGEGGGHGRHDVATLPLLQAVLDAVDVPVLAAGGVATARGLAAVLAAGAVGGWVGTAFLGCPESAWPAARRSRIFSAGMEDTVYTKAFDVGLGGRWPEEFGGRAVRNAFSDTWHGREAELGADADAQAAFVAAFDADDYDQGPVWAGQGVGLLRRERSVAEVVAELAGAEELLKRW